MKVLKFQKKCRLGKLSDELIAAIPALAPVPDNTVVQGAFAAVFAISGNDTTTTLEVPEATDETKVADVVAAHDASIPTAFEIALAQANTNKATLTAKAQTALTANAAFLALASPTNAQTLAQVQMLTREDNVLIRLALGLLDTTAGT